MSTPLYSGIYAILDVDRIAPCLPEDPEEHGRTLLRYAVDAAAQGAVALQLRTKQVVEHSLWLPRILADLRRSVGPRVPIVMNDHLEPLRPLVGQRGFGLHLGQDDATPEHARARLGDELLLGLSTHELEQVRAADDAAVDYIGFGPIRQTEGKELAGPAVGLDELAQACEFSRHPVVAIGGLTEEDLPAVKAAGARCAAVIGAWLGDAGAPNGPNFARMAMADLVAAWRAAP